MAIDRKTRKAIAAFYRDLTNSKLKVARIEGDRIRIYQLTMELEAIDNSTWRGPCVEEPPVGWEPPPVL